MKLPADIQSIIIFRALQLGDMLCVMPAVRALKCAYPNARITLAGMPWASSFTKRFSKYFDDFIWFPGYPGLPEQQLNPAEFTSFLSTVQERQYDLAIQMQGNGSIVNPMIELWGARITAGYFKKDDYAPNGDYFMEYPDYGSEIDRHLQLMNFLGIPLQGNELEFPLTVEDEDDYKALDVQTEVKKYICVHPGSRGAWRQWPTAHFAKLADYCASCGFKVIITGTQQELDIVNNVISQMKRPAVNLAGKTSLGAIGILIKNAYALISNCTGVSHIAAAFKTPSIVISMDGEPERWGPINTDLHYTINWLARPDFDMVFRKTMQILS
ncbi:glycosyltransferase family 9 protein [Mucilaginibacter pocheonensis]|uniref:ADP-heptose:LPS heptosyltransferase n=1 Tax=Mucilaginibacter pocheonensis TaxID=398050 RepID=A0ABU1TCR0_9SPHI|nr:glycosyltransferase family 9 protein [Mucilaginibacter pocheonensis]MDR6943183.1 ADP-heptose:LPS heptosyltransferase [Mucilaginibacter pocheonensis]